jgi:hypothetical protein
LLKGEIITSEKTEKINVKFLRVDPLVKRESYDPRVLKRIEDNIRKNGFRNEKPLVVRPDRKKGKGYWKITCGQHRFEAGINRGICTFPCVKKWSQDDIIAIAEAYEDNVIQCQVDAITEAEYFRKLGLRILKDFGHTNESIQGLHRKYPEEQIALQMGVTKYYVKHRLTLLRLPKEIQWYIRRYYIPSEKGLKINPTVGEELSRLYQNIKMQYESGIIKTDPKKAILEVALKFSREKIKLEEARRIAADIAYKNYDEWSKTKSFEPTKIIRCTKCGEIVPPEDNPWLALCHKDKEEYLNHKQKPNPHLIPLHEKHPESHVVKGVTIPNNKIDNTALVKGVNALNPIPNNEVENTTRFDPLMKQYLKFNHFVETNYGKNDDAVPDFVRKKRDELYSLWKGVQE